MPALDLAVGLGVVGRGANVRHPRKADEDLEIFGDKLRSVVADYARTGRSPDHANVQWHPKTARQQEIGNLAVLREQVMKQRTAVVQQMRAYLREHFPELEAALKGMTNKWLPGLFKLIGAPFDAKQISKKKLENEMRKLRINKTIRARIHDAVSACQEMPDDQRLAPIHRLRLQVWTEQIELYNQDIESSEKHFKKLVEQSPYFTHLNSIKGLGHNLIGVLLELLLDEQAPKSRDELSIRMGSSPVFKGSGEWENGKAKGVVIMRKSAMNRARRASYLIGEQAAKHLDWAREMKKLGKDKKQKLAHIYRRITRSILRIVFALLKTGQDYDNDKYILALRKRGQEWAHNLKTSKEKEEALKQAQEQQQQQQSSQIQQLALGEHKETQGQKTALEPQAQPPEPKPRKKQKAAG